MGQQIIRQPGDEELYAIFDTTFDMITVWDATAEEIEEHFVEEEIRLTRERVRRKLQHVRAGEPRRAYLQFALSWEEALEMDRKHGGEAWREKGGSRT